MVAMVLIAANVVSQRLLLSDFCQEGLKILQNILKS
jgi:hypothetical protein